MRLDWSAVKGRVIKHYSEIFDEYGINVINILRMTRQMIG